LVRLAAALDPALAVAPPRGPLHVVVHDHAGDPVGVVVDEVIDIVEEVVEIDAASRRHGIRGSAVIRGRVTDVVDLDEVLAPASAGAPR
jgi:two-component system chemotaxis sensor kinase CheA